MGNGSSILLANYRPLTTADAGALTAATRPELDWQPVGILETDPSSNVNVTGSGLAASGDRWLIRIAPPSKVPGVIFYPIALRAIVKCSNDTNFDAFFADDACFAINELGPQYWWNWDHVALSNVMLLYDTAVPRQRAINPEFHGFPVRANQTTSDTVADNALAGFCLTIGTWDATVATNTVMHIDARWLAFPIGVDKNAGFYMQRMGFVPP